MLGPTGPTTEVTEGVEEAVGTGLGAGVCIEKPTRAGEWSDAPNGLVV